MATATTTATTEGRFTMSDEEREAVISLRDACDEQKVTYTNLFELFKYVLVVQSSVQGDTEKDKQKRTQLAFDRIKRRREWERQHGLESLDPHHCLMEIHKHAPRLLQPTYGCDNEQRHVVGFAKLHLPPHTLAVERQATVFAGLLFLFDLACPDLDSARRGLSVASVLHDKDVACLQKSYNYLRTLQHLTELLRPIHNYRVKQIYVMSGGFLKRISHLFIQLLPSKLSRRIVFVSHVPVKEHHHERSVQEWVQEQWELYQETVQKLTL